MLENLMNMKKIMKIKSIIQEKTGDCLTRYHANTKMESKDANYICDIYEKGDSNYLAVISGAVLLMKWQLLMRMILIYMARK